ncbi:MAG: 5'-3' exonuclease [Metamycoplasmataceae bacterium]
MKNKILLIDGNLLLFKSFFATVYSHHKLVTNIGINTSAVHTFFLSFIKVIETYKPTHCFIAFDLGEKTKRHEEYKDYKAGREKAPIEIFEQKKIILEILDAMKIKHMDMKGYEGDDLIASLTVKFSNENEILVWSDDQDLLQLIDTNVSVIVKDNKSKQFIIKNIDNFRKLHGFEHYQIPDFKGIAGDSSDNLPGIKGIGQKGAIDLLNKYETLENIYQNILELTPSQQEKFIASKEMAFMCKKLAKLEMFLNVDITFEEIKMHDLINDEVLSILSKYELNTIKRLLQKNDTLALNTID